MSRLKYWLWLSCVPGVRPYTKYKLLRHFGGPEKLFFAQRDELEAALGPSPKALQRLTDKSLAAVERVTSACAERGVGILTLQDAAYPERLRNIPDPPVVLYIWGKLPPVDERLTIAVVGTRRATPYGLRMAARLGGELARAGAVVVSGLAEGCDGMAMEAALRAGGTTVGVLGTAIDEVFPAKNRPLFEAVRQRGALVSEYPPGMRTFPSSFKERNRLIAGLSLGVVVTQAPARSGTRNTVQHALEQGRDVFAVPGNADAPGMTGCNELIAEGAAVATCAADITAVYAGRPGLVPSRPAPDGPTHIKKEIDKPEDIVYIDLSEAKKPPAPKPPEGLPAAQRRVLSAMTRPDMHADELIEATGLSARETLAALTMLQVAGYVVQGAGRRYTRKL